MKIIRYLKEQKRTTPSEVVPLCGQLDDYRTILEEYEALVYFCESIE